MNHHGPHGRQGLHAPFIASLSLTTSFVILEVLFGVRSHSLSLIADAGHNLSDVLALGMAWGSAWLSTRKATERRTYGYQRAGILTALANACLILVLVGGLLWEAARRLLAPQPVQGPVMIAVASVGVLVNLGSALFFLRTDHLDLNLRGAFLHLLADTIASLGVVAAGLAITLTGRAWLDPVLSVAVGLLVLGGIWPLFRDALDLSLDSVPPHVDPGEVRDHLLRAPGVRGLHHLHIWAIGTSRTALSVHLVVETPTDPCLVHDLAGSLLDLFSIHHATIQLEPAGQAQACLLERSHE